MKCQTLFSLKNKFLKSYLVHFLHDAVRVNRNRYTNQSEKRLIMLASNKFIKINLNIGPPYLLTILVIKFEVVHSSTS